MVVSECIDEDGLTGHASGVSDRCKCISGGKTGPWVENTFLFFSQN